MPSLLSFKQEQTVFIVLNLAVLAILLLIHCSLASFWGPPRGWLLATVGVVFLLRIPELWCVRRVSKPVQPAVLQVVTWASVLLNLVLTVLLSGLTDHEDSPYVVLPFLSVLEAAFRFRMGTLLGVVGLGAFTCFFWQWRFFVNHPPIDVGEYIEAGTTSLMLAVVGVLVWLLARDLRDTGIRLANNLLKLEEAREKMMLEERLAAMGRLSSAIAHEIRNPVAMIASSIAAAKRLSGTERDEMFGIASEEAARLSRLTTEFLDYASARRPKMAEAVVGDTLAYVADASRAHASQKGLKIEVDVSENLLAMADAGQLQQALMNLLLNAVDASPVGSTILLGGHLENESAVIDVKNSGLPIPKSTLERMFEPFFTTKPHGTGLGLAIARNVARGQGGDLLLTANGPDNVRFSMILPVPNGKP